MSSLAAASLSLFRYILCEPLPVFSQKWLSRPCNLVQLDIHENRFRCCCWLLHANFANGWIRRPSLRLDIQVRIEYNLSSCEADSLIGSRRRSPIERSLPFNELLAPSYAPVADGELYRRRLFSVQRERDDDDGKDADVNSRCLRLGRIMKWWRRRRRLEWKGSGHSP